MLLKTWQNIKRKTRQEIKRRHRRSHSGNTGRAKFQHQQSPKKVTIVIQIYQRQIQRVARGALAATPLSSLVFAITCFFCNHFGELQTVLFGVELIINNTPSLTYVYPNTIEACLTPNHLLFGRQLLYSPNTTSTVVRNLTVLSSTTNKINHISNHFLDWWRHEYVVNLRETQNEHQN